MPKVWTEPETVVEHNGVTVYNTYKDDEYVSQYWYTLDESQDDWESAYAFDIRDLDAYVESDSENHVEILRAAIESGELQHTADCSREGLCCDVMPGGRWACASPAKGESSNA